MSQAWETGTWESAIQYWAKYDTMTVGISPGNLQRSVTFPINTSSTANNGVALESAIFETTNRFIPTRPAELGAEKHPVLEEFYHFSCEVVFFSN